jgi:hypothetical protein
VNIAQKMDKLLLVCEAARADGWEIAATGETIAPERGCCCPLGALALAAGFDPQNEDLLNPPGVQAGRILDEGNEFRDDFMRGFDGPEYAEAAGLPQSDDPLAYAYGKAFRGLYATQ